MVCRANHSGNFFLKGAFQVIKSLSYCFCAILINAFGHPSGKWNPYSHQHLRLPSSHPYVLGEPLLWTSVTPPPLFPMVVSFTQRKRKDHLLLWLCCAKVPWLGHGDNRVCAPGHDGLWLICSYLLTLWDNSVTMSKASFVPMAAGSLVCSYQLCCMNCICGTVALFQE